MTRNVLLEVVEPDSRVEMAVMVAALASGLCFAGVLGIESMPLLVLCPIARLVSMRLLVLLGPISGLELKGTTPVVLGASLDESAVVPSDGSLETGFDGPLVDFAISSIFADDVGFLVDLLVVLVTVRLVEMDDEGATAMGLAVVLEQLQVSSDTLQLPVVVGTALEDIFEPGWGGFPEEAEEEAVPEHVPEMQSTVFGETSVSYHPILYRTSSPMISHTSFEALEVEGGLSVEELGEEPSIEEADRQNSNQASTMNNEC